MEFSVVLISRNEENTIPRLLNSLAGVGDIVLVDTGSTDKTCDIARSFGVRVYEEGTRFLETVTEEMAKQINEISAKYGEPAIVNVGDTSFNYSNARNYAATLAKNDMIFMPDCDEIVTWDLERVEKEIEGIDRLEYDFVFAHDPEGKPLLSFTHSKFYNRVKQHWVRNIHEVLTGEATPKYVGKEVIILDHWQNESQNRLHYLKGLAIDFACNEYNDRNAHYYARELYYKGRWKSAIEMFELHVSRNGWIMEQAQSLTHIGDCYRQLGERDKAIEAYLRAIHQYPLKREAYYNLACVYMDAGEHATAAVFFGACTLIDKPNFYATFAPIYEDWPWGNLAVSLWHAGKHDPAFAALKKALEFKPEDDRYVNNLQFSIPCPKISVVIPTLGRHESLARLVQGIKDNAGYSNYEIIIVHDGEAIQPFEGVVSLKNEERQGVAKTLKIGVEAAKGDLILFLGNDTYPQKNFMIQALWQMYKSFGKYYIGLVALNDGMWNGELATHWLAHKAILKAIGGEFFHTGYHHVGCDNELTGRVKELGCYAYAEHSKIDHQIQDDEVRKIAWEEKNVHEDRVLLRKRAEEFHFLHHLDSFMQVYPTT